MTLHSGEQVKQHDVNCYQGTVLALAKPNIAKLNIAKIHKQKTL